MHTFYLWMLIINGTAFWALWTFGFRPLILDRFRFEVEGLLDELDRIVATGCLTLTSDVYQTQRATLEGLIQVVPRFGIMQLALSHQHVAETTKGTPEDDALLFEKSIATLQPYAQDALRAIRYRMALITLRFILFRAPFVIALAYTIAFTGYITGRRKRTSDPVESLKREAYDSTMHRSDDHVLV